MTDLAVPAGGELSTEPPDRLGPLVARWLLAVAESRDTVRGYRTDIAGWFGFCTAHGLDPLEVGKSHVDVWVRWLTVTPTKRTGRPPAVATIARAVAAVSSFYAFAVDEGAVEVHPVRKRARPHVPNISSTVGLSRDEARAFMRRLLVESPRDRAVVRMLLVEGLRVAELRGLDVGSVQIREGHVTIRIVGKGRKERRVVLAAPVVEAVDGYLEQRAAEQGLPGAGDLDRDTPLFTGGGGVRLSQQAVTRIVRRIARAAGIRSWASLSPHSLRHACATLMLDAGAALHVVRDQLGHSASSTTERYDRARGALSRTGVHALAAFITPDEPL